MPNCKFCHIDITWEKVGDRSFPKNLDGSNHDCRSQRLDSKEKPPAKRFESRYANVKKVVEVKSDEANSLLAQHEVDIAISWVLLDVIPNTVTMVNGPTSITKTEVVYVLGLKKPDD